MKSPEPEVQRHRTRENEDREDHGTGETEPARFAGPRRRRVDEADQLLDGLGSGREAHADGDEKADRPA